MIPAQDAHSVAGANPEIPKSVGQGIRATVEFGESEHT